MQGVVSQNVNKYQKMFGLIRTTFGHVIVVKDEDNYCLILLFDNEMYYYYYYCY